VILDLEWNSVYGTKIRGFLNEIIEIGAVKLNEELHEIDSFSALVKPKIGKRLRTHTKQLTHIKSEELAGGLCFDEAIANFVDWLGEDEHVVLSWGDGDIRVLLSNTRYHTASRRLDYIQNYVDLQDYFRHRKNTSAAQQIGLAAAGALVGLPTANYALHRATDDSRFAAECFRAVYEPINFPKFMRACTRDFFAELEYKPRIISDLQSPLVDHKQLYYVCRNCGKTPVRTTDWRFASRGFVAEHHCKHCGIKARAMVTFRKMYATVDVKRSSREIKVEAEKQ
jgi:inhibitor of KinA sporulation pathway (predicted exonuclease)/predicted RNA-binding Zn-ribbon protein involved in translation (DUF1610 family)